MGIDHFIYLSHYFLLVFFSGVWVSKICSLLTACQADPSDLLHQDCCGDVVGAEKHLVDCQQIRRKFFAVLSGMQVIAEPDDASGEAVELNILLALQLPAIYQIVSTALKFKWQSPDEAHDRLVEDLGNLWLAVSDVSKSLPGAEGLKDKDQQAVDSVRKLPGQIWDWIKLAAMSAVGAIKEPLFTNFRQCLVHVKSEALQDLYSQAKTKNLAVRTTATFFMAKATSQVAKTLLSQWKMFQNLDKLLSGVREALQKVRYDMDAEESPLLVEDASFDEIQKIKEGNDCKLIQQTLGHLTVFQALWRTMRTGESRPVVCRAALRKLGQMYLSAELKQKLAAEAGQDLGEEDSKDDGNFLSSGKLETSA